MDSKARSTILSKSQLSLALGEIGNCIKHRKVVLRLSRAHYIHKCQVNDHSPLFMINGRSCRAMHDPGSE